MGFGVFWRELLETECGGESHENSEVQLWWWQEGWRQMSRRKQQQDSEHVVEQFDFLITEDSVVGHQGQQSPTCRCRKNTYYIEGRTQP